MTIETFKQELNQRLHVLNEKERTEIISEYVDHITMKMEDGKSEEEAIADFGNIDDLCKEILESYHVNTEYSKAKKTFDEYVSDFAEWISSTAEKVTQMNQKDLVKLILEFLALIVILFILSGVINLIGNMIYSFFGFLPYMFRNPIYTIINIIVGLFNAIFVLYVLYVFFSKKFESNEGSPLRRNSKEKVVYVNKPIEKSMNPSFVEVPKTTKDFSLDISPVFHLLGKIIGILILIPMGLVTLGLIVVFGIIGSLYIGHAMILGPVIILLGCMIIAIAVTSSFGSFIFRKKEKEVKMHEETLD